MITKTEFAFFIITLKKLKDVRKHLQDLNSGIFNFLMLIAQKTSRFFFLSSLFCGFKCFLFLLKAGGGRGGEGGREGGRGGREGEEGREGREGGGLAYLYVFPTPIRFYLQNLLSSPRNGMAFIQDDMLLVVTFCWLKSH